MIENLLIDLRYALRMLLRSPGFPFIAIATMALGVGATTAIYTVIDATLLHPLPYPNPTELIRIQDDLPGAGAEDVDNALRGSRTFVQESNVKFRREPDRLAPRLRPRRPLANDARSRRR